MSACPLFTKEELCASFAMIVAEDEARRRAEEWWNLCADEVDADGRIMQDSEQWAKPAYVIEEAGRPLAAASQPQVLAAGDQAEYWGFGQFRGQTDEQKGEIFIRFTDFTLNLVSLVSDDVARRVQALRGDSAETMARRLTQMRTIVEVMRS
jgi:hypothetical protein